MNFSDKIEIIKTEPNMEYDYHFHMHYEIIYLHNGCAQIFSDGLETTLEAGKVCVIPPFSPHRLKYNSKLLTRIKFDAAYIESFLTEKTIASFPSEYSTKISVSTKRTDEIMASLSNEITNHNGYGAYIYIYKLLSKCVSMSEISRDPGKIVDIMYYIGGNAQNKITLTEIAENCGISKYHVCRLFKKHFGITAVDYITYARIRRAIVMLLRTNLSIAKISKELDFYSPKYFSAIFKSYFDVLPSAFRKEFDSPHYERYYIKPRK